MNNNNSLNRWVDHTYRDYSQYVNLGGELIKHKKSDRNFPAKLHHLVSDPKRSRAITWMPHGRTFKVLDKDLLTKSAIPEDFGLKKYESFTRQLNGWGFKRLHQQGPDNGCYYHECFLRGLPEITCLIRRDPSVSGRFTPHPAGEPNFYMIAEQYPLPNDNEWVAATGTREESSTMPSLAGAPAASRLAQETLPVYDNDPCRPPPPPPQYNESYNHSYPQPQPFMRNGSDGSYPYDVNQYQQATSQHLPPPLSHLPSRNPSFSMTPAQYAQLYAEHHSKNRSSYHSQPESYSAGPSHSSQRIIHQHPQNLAQVTTAREHLAATYGSQYPSMLPPQPPPPFPGAYNAQGLPGSIQDQLGLGTSSNIQPPQAQAYPQDQSVPNGQPSVSPPFAKVDDTSIKVQPSAQDLANSESKVDTDIDTRPAPFESVQFQQAGVGSDNNDQDRTNHVVSVQAPDQDSNEVAPADGSQGQQLGNDGNDHEPSSESPKP